MVWSSFLILQSRELKTRQRSVPCTQPAVTEGSGELPKSKTKSFNSVQSLSCVQLFATQWIEAHQASLSITNSQSSLRLTSMELVMPSSHLILCRPLLLLPSIPPSISLSSEYSGLISFRIDSFDLLAVQGTLKSSLLHSVFWMLSFKPAFSLSSFTFIKRLFSSS